MKRFLLFTAVLAVVITTDVGAQSPSFQVGYGVICDTPAQVERFAALMGKGDNAEKVADQVNAEFGDERACAIRMVMYHIIAPLKKTSTKDGKVVAVVGVVIVAWHNGAGWEQIPPVRQFTLFLLSAPAVKKDVDL